MTEPELKTEDLVTDMLLVIVVMLAIGVLGAAATLETQPEIKMQNTQQ